MGYSGGYSSKDDTVERACESSPQKLMKRASGLGFHV